MPHHRPKEPGLHPYLGDGQRPVAIAHRGGAKEAPENTLAAFAHAVDLGYLYLETDAQLTADGVVVAFHDDSVERVSDQSGKISSWRWDDLKDLLIGGSGKLATVAQLLGKYPNQRFNLDAKSDEVAFPLLETIRAADALDRVCVGSFSDARLARLRAAEPRLCTSAGPFAVVRHLLRSRSLPLGALSCDAVQVPLGYWRLPIITPTFVERAHADGIVVHAWTIDDETVMNELLDMGVDGIMTDRPTLLRSVFEERGLGLNGERDD